MEKPKIDFLKSKYDLTDDKKNNLLFFGRTLVGVLLVGAVIGTVFSYHVATTANSQGDFPKLSIISTIRHFVDGNDLKGEKDDRVNILLMGIGGEGHEGPQLTDTMIFASYQPSSGKIGLMSIPRDLSVPIPGYGYRKVNHANAFGEMEKKGYGPRLSSEVVSAVLDQPVHYFVRVDFEGFAELIDDLGGIDVYVDRGFTDPKYPSHGKEYATCGNSDVMASPALSPDEAIPSLEIVSSSPLASARNDVSPDYSCRFEALTFQEGWAHMDGQTSLKFVRSRHGTNGEGSDFARSARQQKVLLAVKDKVFSASTFLNPARINRILDTLEKNIATNLDVSEIVTLARAVKDLKEGQMTHHVLDASETSPLYATVLNGAFVLLPKNDNWKPLQQIAQYIYEPNVVASRFADAPGEKPKFVKVEIQNGTNVTGLAFRASQLLDGQGFDVVKVGNAETRGYKHTVIYDLSNGVRAVELRALRDFLQADVTLSATGWMVSGEVVPKGITVSKEELAQLTTEPDVDFLVILGENASTLVRN